MEFNSIKKLSVTIISLIAVLLVTGCSLSEDTVEIDEKTYKTDFYPSYLWVNKFEKDGEPVRVGLSEYQKIIDENFELYQSDGFSGKTNGILYCLEEQWDEAYELYHNADNYYYTLGFGGYWLEDDELTIIPDIDYDKFDILAMGSNDNLLHWKELYVGKSTTLELSYEEKQKGTEAKIQSFTNDDRFVSSNQQLFLYENKLYYFIGMDGNYEADDVYYYSPVDDSVNSYFLEIIKEVLIKSGVHIAQSDFSADCIEISQAY